MNDNKLHNKTFKDHYANPEYRNKHLAYIKVKVPCKICGCMVSRSNMTKHTSTTKHQTIIDAKAKCALDPEKLKAAVESVLKEFKEKQLHLIVTKLLSEQNNL